jgi:hypothetical protein
LRRAAPRGVQLQRPWLLPVRPRASHVSTATNLVEHMLPPVPLRQWVLTVPFGLRGRLGFERSFLQKTLSETRPYQQKRRDVVKLRGFDAGLGVVVEGEQEVHAEAEAGERRARDGR